MNPPPMAVREIAREERFNIVWTQELNDVFADVAPYYDRANYIASLGLWGYFLRQFMSTVDVNPRERMLDVCAGTNAIGMPPDAQPGNRGGQPGECLSGW